MTTTTFDTMAYAKRFKAAGFTEQQAEEVVTALREIRDDRMEESATKGDIELAKLELRKEIESAKVEIIKWVIATGIVILGGLATINRMFPPMPIYLQPPAQELRLPTPAPAVPPGR
ncbi:DUF1640 domain-containing protein [Candidatus Magnetaquicoccus inordinatus]|uniref:DUF1640 domain-containing protein n=1 Tax=Candidatus Magnetaquicoccus inordinatus TaxID=2496818 RepID=UPI00187D23ED|nr:DUF1640 domain-containing protein [Candidatus Magnetaquicoccus inordinatus]